MRCKNCEYRLWALPARTCPECGTPFRPSEFEFVSNSVRFCCPHCNQDYYGTGAKGHLVPAQFTCVNCGRGLHMDDMVLFPTAGVEEEQTQVEKMPWLSRHERGRVKAWFSTVGAALVGPGRLMRQTPVTSPAGQAWWFCLINMLLAMLVTMVPFGMLMFWAFAAIGGWGGRFGVVGGSLGILLLIVGGSLLYVAIWGLTAHGLLRATGGSEAGPGRTFQAVCYGSGAYMISAVPCLAMYLSVVGWVWWMVSSVLMLSEGQRVHGGRAALAVLLWPILSLVVGGFALVHYSGSLLQFPNLPGTTQNVLSAIETYAEEHEGQGPPHSIVLVEQGLLSGFELVSPMSNTSLQGVPVGDGTLLDFDDLDPEEARVVVQAEIDALGPEAVAHRLGDFVFTYHGIDLSAEANADPGLWLVIFSSDPDSAARGVLQFTFEVGMADGTILSFPAADLPSRLSEQNDLRNQLGLPPLPDPSTIRHRTAVGEEEAPDEF